MIRTLIIDDEDRGRVALAQKLKDYCPDVELLGEACDGEEGIAMIVKYSPDLVFLDIEMPNLNGFEMLNKISQKKFNLIFTTAYNHYAIKAIKYSALDYLLKPIDIEELKSAIIKIKENDTKDINQQMNILSQNLDNKKWYEQKFAVSTLEGITIYNIADLIYLESNRNYTYLYFKDKLKVLTSKTLKEYEDMLPSDVFYRPHHSFLINLNFVRKFIKGEGGQIELSNGALIDISRRKKEEFLQLLSKLTLFK
jgi:two-component system, LytTR family, response regulator